MALFYPLRHLRILLPEKRNNKMYGSPIKHDKVPEMFIDMLQPMDRWTKNEAAVVPFGYSF